MVFDTTSVNTGIRHGIVVRLEEMLAKPLLQLACRHHIFELMCGAACRKVYGPTTGPTQASFKKLIAVWGDLDKVKCSSIQISQTNRYLASMVQETSAFLQQWLEKNDGQTLRHDYRELASLTLLFLGSTDPGESSRSHSSCSLDGENLVHYKNCTLPRPVTGSVLQRRNSRDHTSGNIFGSFLHRTLADQH